MEEEFEPGFDPEVLALVRRFEASAGKQGFSFFDASEFEEIIDFYLFRNQTRAAVRALRNGLEQHPGHTPLLLKKVQIYITSGKEDKALRLLNEIAAEDDTDPETHLLRGNLFSQLGKPARAISELKKAVHEGAELDEIYSGIAFEYEISGNMKKRSTT